MIDSNVAVSIRSRMLMTESKCMNDFVCENTVTVTATFILINYE